MRRSLCPHCRKRLEPNERIHMACVEPWAEALQAKADRVKARKARELAKLDRALVRQRKAALKTIPDLIKEAQREFNAFIRERDKDKPCICCGEPLSRGHQGTGGEFDCGHWRSVGSASHLRFDERNAHGQRKVCNRYGAGRAVEYRVGLIDRLGASVVEALEADNTPHKWTREELIEIRDHYRAKVRELKRQEA